MNLNKMLESLIDEGCEVTFGFNVGTYNTYYTARIQVTDNTYCVAGGDTPREALKRAINLLEETLV